MFHDRGQRPSLHHRRLDHSGYAGDVLGGSFVHGFRDNKDAGGLIANSRMAALPIGPPSGMRSPRRICEDDLTRVRMFDLAGESLISLAAIGPPNFKVARDPIQVEGGNRHRKGDGYRIAEIRKMDECSEEIAPCGTVAKALPKRNDTEWV